MAQQKPTDPEDRMGIYKQPEDIPNYHRLSQYQTRYDGRDIWDAFSADFLFERYNSERFKQKARRVRREWKTRMEVRRRHHALATPMNVER